VDQPFVEHQLDQRQVSYHQLVYLETAPVELELLVLEQVGPIELER
jgi:hypothetical protein